MSAVFKKIVAGGRGTSLGLKLELLQLLDFRKLPQRLLRFHNVVIGLLSGGRRPFLDHLGGPSPKPRTLEPKPYTPNLKAESPNPKPQTLDPKPSTPNPTPQTLNPKP